MRDWPPPRYPPYGRVGPPQYLANDPRISISLSLSVGPGEQVWTPKDRCLISCRIWRSTRCDSQKDGCSAEFNPWRRPAVAAVPAAGASAAGCARQREDHEQQDVHGRTECPGWIRRAIAAGQRGIAGGSGPAGHLPKAMLALEQHAWPGGPPPLAWLGGCCEPTDLLRRVRMRAVMSRAPPAGGSWCRSRWPRRVRRRSRPAGILWAAFTWGIPGLGWSSGRSRAAEMPGPEQVTDLPAPPQEGRPMRPAGGEQARPGWLAPQGAGARVLAGNRR